MKEYIITLVGVAILNGVVGMISPEGNIKKYIHLLGALCILCALVFPFASVLSKNEISFDGLLEYEGVDRSEYDEIYNNSLISGGEKNAEYLVKNSIIKEFDLSEDAIEVRIESELKNSTMEIRSLAVIIKEKSFPRDPREIVAYANEKYQCSCTIIYQ